MGRFSVAAGAGPSAGVFGSFVIQGVVDGQTFREVVSFDNQLPPAPGALALLGLAGLCGRRQRNGS